MRWTSEAHRKHLLSGRMCASCGQNLSQDAGGGHYVKDNGRRYEADVSRGLVVGGAASVRWWTALILMLSILAGLFSWAHGDRISEDEEFWKENAQLLAASDDLGGTAVNRKSLQEINNGFAYCPFGDATKCSQEKGEFDVMQNSEGILDEAVQLVFKPPRGKSVNDYKFSARSTNEELLRDSEIGIDWVATEDNDGNSITNTTVGLKFEPTVGKTDLVVTAEDQTGNDDKEFELSIAVAGLMFVDSDVSTLMRESEYMASTTKMLTSVYNRQVRPEEARQHMQLKTWSTRMGQLEGDRYVAEGVLRNNELEITSYESLVRNRYVYMKVDKLFKTHSMKKALRIRDIRVNFEKESYAKQVKWADDRCRIAPISRKPVKAPKGPDAPPDPVHMSRPRPGFLKGINPQEMVNLTRSECGISFSYTGDLLGLRFEKYRVGDGNLRIRFTLDGFLINDRPATFETDLRIRIKNHLDAPPAYHRLVMPKQLDPNGGQEVHVWGFNVPKDPTRQLGLSVMLNGERRVFPEDPSKRRAHDRYDTQMTFVSLPGTGESRAELLEVPENYVLRSADLDSEKIEEMEGIKIFAHVSHEFKIEYQDLDLNKNDVEYTIGFPNVTNLFMARAMHMVRGKYAEAIGLGGKNVFTSDCKAGSFFAINGRTGIIASSASSVNTAAGVGRFFEDWTEVPEDEIRKPTPLPSPSPPAGGSQGVAVSAGGAQLAIKMIGEKIRFRFRAPEGKRDHIIAKIEEYVASGRAFSDSGIQQHLIAESEMEEQINLAGGTLNIAAFTTLLATLVAAVGVQLGSAVAGGAAASMLPTLLDANEAFNHTNAAMSEGTRASSANANPTTVLRTVQTASARGLVAADGITSPYKDVAQGASGFLLLVNPPWDNDPKAGTSNRLLQTARSQWAQPWKLQKCDNLQGELFTTARNAQALADVLESKNLERIFIAQLFYIALGLVIFAAIYVFVKYGLRRWKRTRDILLGLLPKVFLLFLNYIHLGVFIGGFRVLFFNSRIYLKVIAVLLILLFGVGYPIGVFWILKTKVSPNLNRNQLKDYFRRHIKRGGWSWFRRHNDHEHHLMSESRFKHDREDLYGHYWFVERRSRRFSGIWVSKSLKFQARFGDIFEQYRGQYYLFFFWELLELSIEGIAIGALQAHQKWQAAILISASAINFLALLWLVPYNDLFEQVVQLLLGFINVITASVTLYLVGVSPSRDRAKVLSTVHLWLSVSAIVSAAIYGLYVAIEVLWLNRSRFARFIRCVFHSRSSAASSSLSSSTPTGSSRLSTNQSLSSRSISLPQSSNIGDSDIGSPLNDDDAIEDMYYDYREPYNRDGTPLDLSPEGSNRGRYIMSVRGNSDESHRQGRSGPSDLSSNGANQPTLASTKWRQTWSSQGSDGSGYGIRNRNSGERAERPSRARERVASIRGITPVSSHESNWTAEFDVCSSGAEGSIAAQASTPSTPERRGKRRSYALEKPEGNEAWTGGEEILSSITRRSTNSNSSSATPSGAFSGSSSGTISRKTSQLSLQSASKSLRRSSATSKQGEAANRLDSIEEVD